MMATDRDAGMVTVETAMSLCALIMVIGLALTAVDSACDQLRCTDAAREAARLTARGEPDLGRTAAARIAPGGARIAIQSDGDTIAVEVTAQPARGLLPGLHLTGRAYAVAEPGAAEP
jgi:hypothetical protein